MELIQTLHSTSKSKSVINFHESFIEFKLIHDHTPRRLAYDEMDQILIKKMWIFWKIYFAFVLIYSGATIYIFFTERLSIFSLMTALCLLVLVLVNYYEGNSRKVQIKKGALLIDVFSSYKRKEVTAVFDLLLKKSDLVKK